MLATDNTTKAQKRTGKKKSTRMFEAYISPLLKQVSPNNGIQEDAKQQLNSAMQLLSKEISNQTILLLEIPRKRTIFPNEVENAIKLLVSGDLRDKIIQHGQNAVSKYAMTEQEKSTDSVRARQSKAGITLPPSVMDKFLRQFGYSNVLLNRHTSVFFAGAIEEILTTILSNASHLANVQKKKRITVRNIKLSIEQNKDLHNLFEKANINFLGGGVSPFIHQSLCTQKSTKGKGNNKYRPGTVSIKQMKKLQANDEFVLAKAPFEKCVRTYIHKAMADNTQLPKIGHSVFIILQHFIEQQVIQTLRQSMLVAIHTGRRKLLPSDITLIQTITGNAYNGYIENPNVDKNDENNENNDNEE